jgi:hypothetical protein
MQPHMLPNLLCAAATERFGRKSRCHGKGHVSSTHWSGQDILDSRHEACRCRVTSDPTKVCC